MTATCETWPGPDTPLLPTNAILHIMSHEIGHGTLDRELVMQCGVRWKTANGGSGGEHKFVFESETWWHKHVNCENCLKTLEGK